MTTLITLLPTQPHPTHGSCLLGPQQGSPEPRLYTQMQGKARRWKIKPCKQRAGKGRRRRQAPPVWQLTELVPGILRGALGATASGSGHLLCRFTDVKELYRTGQCGWCVVGPRCGRMPNVLAWVRTGLVPGASTHGTRERYWFLSEGKHSSPSGGPGGGGYGKHSLSGPGLACGYSSGQVREGLSSPDQD